MERPILAPSARNHGVSRDAMIHAVHNAILVEQVTSGLTMFIGPDRAGNLPEVGVVDGADGPVIVHAMRARSKYLRRP